MLKAAGQYLYCPDLTESFQSTYGFTPAKKSAWTPVEAKIDAERVSHPWSHFGHLENSKLTNTQLGCFFVKSEAWPKMQRNVGCRPLRRSCAVPLGLCLGVGLWSWRLSGERFRKLIELMFFLTSFNGTSRVYFCRILTHSQFNHSRYTLKLLTRNGVYTAFCVKEASCQLVIKRALYQSQEFALSRSEFLKHSRWSSSLNLRAPASKPHFQCSVDSVKLPVSCLRNRAGGHLTKMQRQATC